MKQIFGMIMCLALFAGLPAFADKQKAMEAFEKGDYETALRESKLLAKQGDADTLLFLGGRYYYGWGTPQDYQKATEFFKFASENGIATGQHLLAQMYNRGHGFPKDYVIAYMWANISASKDDEDAAKLRDDIAKNMTTEQIAEAQKLARECVAKDYKEC